MEQPAAIILNYRKANLTLRCVRSLVSQVAEIVIVDNSESDAETALLCHLLAPLRQQTLLTIVKSNANRGFGKGVNYGVRNLTGSYAAVLIFNNDAVAHSRMVEHMQQTLRAYDGKAIVSAVSTGRTPSELWYHRSFCLVLSHRFPGAFRYLTGACLLIPMALISPHLFDGDFFMYGEDVELSWRMANFGIPLVVSAGQFEHEGSASSGQNTFFYEYYVAKGHYILGRKLAHGFADRCLLKFGRLVMLPVRAIYRCIRFSSTIPLRALFLACFSNTENSRVSHTDRVK